MDWQNKTKQNAALHEQDTIKVMFFLSKENGKKSTLPRKEWKNPYHNLQQRKIMPWCELNKYEDWQHQNYTQKLTQK